MPGFLKGYYVRDPDPPPPERGKPLDHKGVFRTLVASGKNVPATPPKPSSKKVRYGQG